MKVLNTRLVNVIRVISDLQYGIPIILKYKKQKSLIVGIERITDQVFEMMKKVSKNLDLVISDQRSNFLRLSESKISCNELQCHEIKKIIFSHTRRDPKSLILSHKTYVDDMILKLLNVCELIPAALVSVLNSNTYFSFNIHSIQIDDISLFLSQINNNLYEVCSANIKLQSTTAVIKCFRSQFLKDHYAVIINPKNKNIVDKYPLLRVHSSCFTGDILQSIRCDCYQQLTNAIKIMSKNNGGILLYLNQEGRGIGLTNKIRIYKSQDMGFDTIEANQNLGFEADSRDFLVAAKILKLLKIQAVDLLSNNPNKKKILTDNRITIRKVIPHQFLNQENKQYYKTKVKYFNHTSII